MPIQSDLQLNASKFDPSRIDAKTHDVNGKLVEIGQRGPRWYEVGAERFRQMRWNGETAFPKPTVIPTGENFEIPSRESSRKIPCRMFKPSDGSLRGVFMHIHGGGWVLQSEHYQDRLLKYIADEAGLAVISVGYRLAPEHPYPAGTDDCYDAAEHLMHTAKTRFGGDLMFIGGESAGGHLSMVTMLALRKTHPEFNFRGIVLHFGCFDLSMLPACHLPPPTQKAYPILDREIIEKFTEAFLPGMSLEEKRRPEISPFYADLVKAGGKKLPPALFTVGTEDPLVEDSVLMATRYAMAGAESILRVYEGAPHGFLHFEKGALPSVDEGLALMKRFLLEKLEGVSK